MRLLFLIMLLFWAAPASAQLKELLRMNAEEEALYLSTGHGSQGRYTVEQSELIAWRSLAYARPVEAKTEDSYWQNGRFYHVVEVAVRDGSVYSVIVNSFTGDVFRTELDFLSDAPVLPSDVIDVGVAEVIAVSTVSENTRGARTPTVNAVNLIVYQKRLAYEVRLKKVGRSYVVMVDARSGKMMDFLERE